MARLRRWLLPLLGLVIAFPVHAGETAAAIRAALLFNFIKFTEWPAPDKKPMSVCIDTSDPEQTAAFEALRGRTIRNRPLAISRFQPDADCDVIYLDTPRSWREISQYDTGQALTIGDYSGFVAEGGMIEIVLQESGSHFEINLSQARRAGLRLYPQLLKLAHRIVE